jgi:hypothetical protein
MTEAEEKTFVRRQETFIKEGLDVVDAEDLAFSMMIRDREGLDDRRLCFECKHYKDKYCEAIRDSKGKPTEALRFMLQRCPQFKLKGT